MQIVVHSIDQIRSYIPDTSKKNIVIRIEETDVPLIPLYEDELHLQFADLTAEDVAQLAAQGITDAFVLFHEGHVAEIIRFLEKHRDADILHVHCHAGVSRSPAVALSIARYLGIPEESIDFRGKQIRPNQTVLDVFSSFCR